ncbi:YecR family lipoprotein [Stenotrophomonas maltophilia]|uniref:YecR family lipoprotein n=1 Tax=Stenotrophomonas maltophilia TaxID=40324 RepID=UPI0009B25DBD
MRANTVLVAIVLAALTGCTTHRELLVTGGSRADGIVELGYQRNEFQRVSFDEDAAEALASKRCQGWGYEGAESFGTERSTCTSRRGFGNCGSRQVVIQYQCLGNPSR